MPLSRRRSLQLVLSASAIPFSPRLARAQTYPSKPVRIVVGFPAGGVGDIMARLIGQALSERLGQAFIIENRPGAAGNIGTEIVVRSPPDGYTLFLINTANAVNATLYKSLTFNFLRDIAPIAGIASAPNVLEVHPSVPAKGLAEFIAYAKANPGKINYGSAGIGSLTHMSMELFKMMTGTDLVHVPYRGGAPALTDLLGGQVQVMFDTLPTSVEHIRSGRVQALGVSSATRSEAIPNVPPVSDVVSGYDASGWYGIGAPKDTPRDIADKLNAEINAAIAEARLKQRLSELGGVPLTGPSTNFARIIADDTAKWAEVVKFSGAKAD
jgi:tripartite-type tricarboxylate transporter receptor subunit TctC